MKTKNATWATNLRALLWSGLLILMPLFLSAADKAPLFTLSDINGKQQSLADYKGSYVVLEWVNHGCPFVKKHYGSGNMQALQQEMKKKGVVWLSICSSAEGKQGFMSQEEWRKTNQDLKGAAHAVLLDPSGKVGKMYKAKTTPHMFVIDPAGTIIYQGAIDDRPTTNPEDVKGAKNHVRSALDEALAGKPVSLPATQAYGCSVKYK